MYLNQIKMEKEINAPIIKCNGCDEEMTIVEQKHKPKNVQIKYECECGWSGLVLYKEDDTYDLFVYDSDKKMKRFDSM